MAIESNNDVAGAREETLKALVEAVNDLSSNLASDSTLQTGLEELQDLLLTINANINDGVPMTASDLSALESVTATIIGLPTDYPDSGTHTRLDTLSSALAAVLDVEVQNFPTNFPDTAAHSKLDTVNSHLSTLEGYVDGLETNTAGTNTRLDSVNTHLNTLEGYVDGIETALGTDTGTPPSSGSGIRGWLRGVYDRLANLTDGTQQSKITNGTTIADVLAGGSGQNALLTAGTYTETAFSASATGGQTTIDAADYAYVSVVATSLGTGGVVTFQGSHDGTTWETVQLIRAASQGNGSGASSTASIANNTYGAPLVHRYFRVNITSLTSGTVTGKVTVYTAPRSSLNVASSVVGGGATADAASSGNALVNTNTYISGYNGSTWDRIRAGVRAHLTTASLIGAIQIVTNSTDYFANHSTTGAKTTQDLGQAVAQHGLQVGQSAGTVTGAKVRVEGSISGTEWVTLLTWDTSAGQSLGDIVWVTGKPVRYIRLQVDTLAGSTPQIRTGYIGAV